MKRFKIAHIDPLGQGVSKLEEKICFIPKTLPGETGTYRTKKENSKIQFGSIDTLDEYSEHRIDPICTHFNDCPSCDYLHTNYEFEIELKKQAFVHQFKSLLTQEELLDKLEIVKAPERIGYRNRIQLHYDLKLEKLGAINGKTGQIAPIPNCLIGNKLIEDGITQLYKNNDWINKANNFKQARGHIEVSSNKGEIRFHWNKPYSADGFTQVHESMNKILCNEVNKCFESMEGVEKILDLFGGSGNLSQNFNKKTFVVDNYPHKMKNKFQKFVKTNIYKTEPELFINSLDTGSFDLFLLDPPRSGLKNLKNWTNAIEPKYLLYISCFAPKMIRDLSLVVDQFDIQKIQLLDLFPSTHHFETLILLKNKDHS